MYKINKTKNDIQRLEESLFKDLGYREREHLQEWIAKNPEVLGEDMLIIQKEYQGFNDTNERLDLLAIDKSGDLVIIENKLDDTGRNVVWQALKYASYCSTLTTSQIIRIYQEYLDQEQTESNAKENILEFLEREDDTDLLLNANDQRIIFIANQFRKEVTSTVLWLLNHEVNIQCFRVTPYLFDGDEFLQIEQIIPIPETTEFMIDAKQKEKENKGVSKKVQETNALLLEFWSQLKQQLKIRNLDYLDRVSAKPHYSIGFWKSAGKFAFCVGRKSFRVELYFMNDSDKIYFDKMYAYREQLEKKIPELQWQRLDNKKASRIKIETKNTGEHSFDYKFDDKQNWEGIIKWYCDTMENFYKVIYPVWGKVQQELKA
ncbi:MAG: DUF4268 domain-containing protein [Bacteroidetes bacterium]|jgi:hypothetical protein|nr:DUF4268 domain-containing protein [Bacteroidota bacterium]